MHDHWAAKHGRSGARRGFRMDIRPHEVVLRQRGSVPRGATRLDCEVIYVHGRKKDDRLLVQDAPASRAVMTISLLSSWLRSGILRWCEISSSDGSRSRTRGDLESCMSKDDLSSSSHPCPHRQKVRAFPTLLCGRSNRLCMAESTNAGEQR